MIVYFILPFSLHFLLVISIMFFMEIEGIFRSLGVYMSKINYCRFVVIVGLCFSLFGLVSCGWPVTETKTYHAPNWTPDGRIVAEVQVVKLQRTLVSNSEYVGGYTGIVIMDKDVSNEELLFETPGGGASRIEVSPSGNYVGVILGVGLYLYDSDGSLLKEIFPEPVLTHIKFSPDESTLYGSRYSAFMKFFDVPDLNVLVQNDFGGGEFGSMTILFYIVIEKYYWHRLIFLHLNAFYMI